MKYNLKNRPEPMQADLDDIDLWEISNWFEGFEKELREMLANDDMSPLIRIKEILGE